MSDTSGTTVRTPVTGVVLAVSAAVDDSVAEGDELVIIESMKMEIPVESPLAGRIVSIDVVVGQAVSEGEAVVIVQ